MALGAEGGVPVGGTVAEGGFGVVGVGGAAGAGFGATGGRDGAFEGDELGREAAGTAGGASAAFNVTRTVSFLRGTLDVCLEGVLFSFSLMR